MTNATKGKLLLSTMLMGCIGFTANAQIVTNDGTAILDQDTDAVELREQELLENIASGDDTDNIIVTGTRTRRPDLTTAFPTLVVGEELLEKNAFTTVADALNQIPAFGGGVDPSGDQGANIGVNFVDFLDLGTQRTLTLVNGRRFVSSNVSTGGGASGSQVDLNIIPIGLVERIETIGVGGAPTYGSDAIAGTINFILKDDYEGAEATVQFGETERGDASTERYSFLAGANTEDGRGNVTFNVEYTENDGLLQTDRPEIYIDEPFTSRVPQGTAGFNDIPVPERTDGMGRILDRNGEFVTIDADMDGFIDAPTRIFNAAGGNGQNVQLFTNGGIVSTGRTVLPSLGAGTLGGTLYGFAPNGTLQPLEAGQGIPGTSLFFAQGGFDNDFFAQVDQIQSPTDRVTFGSTFRYELNDLVTFRGDFQAANSNAVEAVEQGGFQTFAFGGTSGPIQFNIENPFLGTQARNILVNEGGVERGDGTFFLSRFNNDIVQNGARQSETNLWRIAGGFEGDFNLGEREFYYTLDGVYGESNIEIQNTLINNQRFLNAIDVVRDADGNPACRVTVEAEPDLVGSGLSETSTDVTDCQPLNLFGENRASAESLEYILQRGIISNDIDQSVFTATLGGDVVELPAGNAQFVVGFETRREEARFQTGGAIEVGLGRAAATPDSGGEFDTEEYFGELYVPLVSSEMDIPFVQALEVGGQVREVDNSQAGKFTAWTVEGTYQPIEDFSLRGNITRSLRGPSLAELFQPVVTAFSFGDDPCDARFINAGENRAANCAAIGITQPFTSNVVNATAQGRTGGNPNLTNETADAYTIGGVLQPRWVPGLTFQADYINIELENRIGVQSLENNLETCFDADPADFPNVACSTFTRDDGGQIIDFQSGQLNADAANYQFLNLRADYDFEMVDLFNLFGGNRASDYGTFSLDTSAFHVIERELIVANVVSDNTVGNFFDPQWSGTIDGTFTKGGLRLFWRAFWQDNSFLSGSGQDLIVDANDQIVDDIGWNWVHNASISYDLSENLSNYDKPLLVQFNVNNVFDDDPGRGLRRTFGDFYDSEVFGRSYSLRLRASF